jgi:hypothetical protein
VCGTSEPLLNKLHPEKIKKLCFPLLTSLFWAGIILSIIPGYRPLLAISGAAIISDLVTVSGRAEYL